ncbi:hypothetical protein Esi_0266_0024 [Ectocarpus siliculosus]|uniref:Uncharacterized protein n=1 Tax=Ectocarpus siliculosus TaxID=2880 RepID=D7FU62_ECTSI|nr:hypothetical protein Esi_0266_0024 [Ectocarpus siliculosus]|eukprot:CBJ31589.1 hypothetical protein Esi_0266_0024 [Ectocarpus siliculosus]
MSDSALLWGDILSGVPAIGTRPSGLEERDGEIRLQRKWAASLVNDKAAIPVPRATQDPGNSKRYKNSSLKREARRNTRERAAGLRRYPIQLDEEWDQIGCTCGKSVA